MRSKFKCLDCNIDTGKIGEHYMLKDEIWSLVHDSPNGMLCIACIEKRLGRPLNSNDFNDSHINRQQPGKIFSALLSSRLFNK